MTKTRIKKSSDPARTEEFRDCVGDAEDVRCKRGLQSSACERVLVDCEREFELSRRERKIELNKREKELMQRELELA